MAECLGNALTQYLRTLACLTKSLLSSDPSMLSMLENLTNPSSHRDQLRNAWHDLRRSIFETYFR
ncbi:hypothetical protein RJ641_000033 [Dillenia turbinata]|uniref:Uncharacterized protein n=1 Tax=Dillenia turbinata TaxID=194707 RepID=A0AAN8YVE0_9MAGN